MGFLSHRLSQTPASWSAPDREQDSTKGRYTSAENGLAVAREGADEDEDDEEEDDDEYEDNDYTYDEDEENDDEDSEYKDDQDNFDAEDDHAADADDNGNERQDGEAEVRRAKAGHGNQDQRKQEHGAAEIKHGFERKARQDEVDGAEAGQSLGRELEPVLPSRRDLPCQKASVSGKERPPPLAPPDLQPAPPSRRDRPRPKASNLVGGAPPPLAPPDLRPRPKASVSGGGDPPPLAPPDLRGGDTGPLAPPILSLLSSMEAGQANSEKRAGGQEAVEVTHTPHEDSHAEQQESRPEESAHWTGA